MADPNILTTVDKAQIASAIGTVVAALLALLTTIGGAFLRFRDSKERLASVQPVFLITSSFEDRLDKKIDLYIRNVGFERVLKIDSYWKGEDVISSKIIPTIRDKDNNHDFLLKINYSKDYIEDKDIKGKLFIVYTDTLGKNRKAYLEIKIVKKFYPLTEEYNPELVSVNNMTFKE